MCKEGIAAYFLFITPPASAWMDWGIINFKGCGSVFSWPNMTYYANIYLDGLSKTTESHNDSRGLQIRNWDSASGKS